MATGVNLHIDVNGRLHHTDKFEHPNLIVRRGQPFELTVTFSRAFDASKDTIILQFAVGTVLFLYSLCFLGEIPKVDFSGPDSSIPQNFNR